MIPTADIFAEDSWKRHIINAHFPTESGSYYIEFVCEAMKENMDIVRTITNLVSIGEFAAQPDHCAECLLDYNKRLARFP